MVDTRGWKDIVIAVSVSVILTGGGAWVAFAGDSVTQDQLRQEIQRVESPVKDLTRAVRSLEVEIARLSTTIDERTVSGR